MKKVQQKTITNELIKELKELAKEKGYLYTDKDKYLHRLLFNRFNITSLAKTSKIAEACERYDKEDYLMILDTSFEVFWDLGIIKR